MADSILSRPTLIGTMRESPLYESMNTNGLGTILLIGHADANVMYEPFQVVNMQEAVNYLQADSNSPLLRSMLEVYNAGIRDIWIYAAAPMNEYVDVTADRTALLSSISGKASIDESFYERWQTRLASAYSALLESDFYEIVVPVEAVHYDSGDVDFTTQLAEFCIDSFATSGSACIGILGTRISSFSQASIDAMVNDPRLATIGDGGKFVLVVVGEGLINSVQMPVSYKTNMACQTAALLSDNDLSRSIAGLNLPGIVSLNGNNLSDPQIQQLALAKLNPAVRSARGKRGTPYQVKLITDNTLATDGSDYWASSQTLLITRCINTIRDYGWVFIGSTNIEGFERSVNSYLNELRNTNIIRNFTLDIDFKPLLNKATVTVGLAPYTTLRNIYFTVETGPGV